MTTTEAVGVTTPDAPVEESFFTRVWENIKGGNLGSWPVVIGLSLIVLVFSLTAQNFFTAVNFNNVITQMAGTTMLAYGIVFVLLLGEIDLSIAPVILGGGSHLFEGLERGSLELEQVRAVDAPGVTHIKYLAG